MKLVRYGEVGAEKPGILDPEGKIRDLSGVVKDIAGDVLGPEGLKHLKSLDVGKLPPVDGQPAPRRTDRRRCRNFSASD